MNHGNLNHGSAGVSSFLTVFRQSPTTAQPRKRALYDPALWQMHEAFCVLGSSDDLQLVIHVVVHPVVQLVVVVLVVSVNGTQSWKPFRIHGSQYVFGRNGVIHSRGGHHHRQQHPQGIHDNMAFAAAYLFAAIVAALLAALFGGLHRLAVDGRYARLVVTARLAANFATQQVDDFIPSAALDPSTVIVVTGSPAWKFMRNHAPLAAATHQIKQRVDHLAQVSLARASARLGAR